MSRLYICTIIIIVIIIFRFGQLSRNQIPPCIYQPVDNSPICLPTEDHSPEWKMIEHWPVDKKVNYLNSLYLNIKDKIPQFPAFVSPGLAHVVKGNHDSVPERYTVEYMERLFYPEKFDTRKFISWIRNPKTNKPLQIDGYSENLKIGVEYNGIQHYQWPNFLSMDKTGFLNQVYRDEIKRSICKQYAFFLIIIPYTVNIMNIPYYIYYSLLQATQQLNKNLSVCK